MSTTTDNDVPPTVRDAAKAADARILEMMKAARGDASQPQGAAGDNPPPSGAGSSAEGAGGEGGGAPPAPAGVQSTFHTDSKADSTAPLESTEDLRRELAKARNDADSWKGRHRADTGRMQAQLDALAARLDELVRGGQSPQSGQSGHGSQDTGATTEDTDEYGEGLINLITRIATAVAKTQTGSAVAAVQARLDAMHAQVGTVQTETKRTRQQEFWSELDNAAPEWRTLDTDSTFVGWLQQFDPYAMRTRKEVLDDALAALNSTAVISLIRAFQGQTGRNGPQVQQETRPAPGAAPQPPAQQGAQAPVAAEPPASLMDFAAPGAARGAGAAAAAPVQTARKTWTRAEIRQFYRDVQDGKYTADPQRRTVIEMDIIAATGEGRIAD